MKELRRKNIQGATCQETVKWLQVKFQLFQYEVRRKLAICLDGERMKTEEKIVLIQNVAQRMRRNSLDMARVAGSNGAHLGPGYSMCELMAALYFGVMHHDPQNPLDPERDRFILSKGHGVLGYYTVLAEAGYFPVEMLKTFETNDSPLAGHPSIHRELGIDFSTGSLGHGLSLGVGTALAAKKAKKDYITYEYQLERYGLTAEKIAEQIVNAFKKETC